MSIHDVFKLSAASERRVLGWRCEDCSVLALSYDTPLVWCSKGGGRQRASFPLDPNNADSYALQADVLNIALGRPAEALPMIEQAIRLNPHYPPFYLIESGYAYRMTGQYTEAIAALKELISRNPTFLHAYNNLATSYLWQWRAQQSSAAQTLEEALTTAQQALTFKDPLDWNYMTLGYVYLYQQQGVVA